jgi:hypothetical protein
MPSKTRPLDAKIGPTVIDFVAMAIETLAERDRTRMQLFRPGRNANKQLVSKVWRDDLIDAMAVLYPETRNFPEESLKRALNDKVQFLTDAELKSGRNVK